MALSRTVLTSLNRSFGDRLGSYLQSGPCRQQSGVPPKPAWSLSTSWWCSWSAVKNFELLTGTTIVTDVVHVRCQQFKVLFHIGRCWPLIEKSFHPEGSGEPLDNGIQCLDLEHHVWQRCTNLHSSKPLPFPQSQCGGGSHRILRRSGVCKLMEKLSAPLPSTRAVASRHFVHDCGGPQFSLGNEVALDVLRDCAKKESGCPLLQSPHFLWMPKMFQIGLWGYQPQPFQRC